MRELAARFVPCADEVWYLQHRPGPEADFFRSFCEKGHYGGRTHPTDTRQGIYCVAPSGEFLASINTTDPAAMARMLATALKAWEALAPETRRGAAPPDPLTTLSLRAEGRYPAGGLVLAVHSRDLPRKVDLGSGDWRRGAHNLDFAWFTPEEVRAMLPAKVAEGESGALPDRLAARLVRCHFVDNVRGQTLPYRPEQVERAEIVVTVRAVAEGVATLDIAGASRAAAGDRGMELALTGRARYDTKARRFLEFELVAVGERWGATTYNSREGDLGRAPIGFALVIARDDQRVAPAHFWNY